MNGYRILEKKIDMKSFEGDGEDQKSSKQSHILDDYFFISPGKRITIDDLIEKFNFSYSIHSLERFISEESKYRRPLIILIGGPSSTGKSSLAVELSRLFGIRTIVGTDLLRVVLSKFSPEYKDTTSLFSHECWKAISSEYTSEALIKGFQKQCNVVSFLIREVCLNSVRHVQNTLIEGVHLTPKIVNELIQTIEAQIIPLFLMSSKDHFQEFLLPKRTKSTYMHRPLSGYVDRMEKFFILLDWWFHELKEYNLKFIENNCGSETILFRAVNEIFIKLPTP